MSANQWWGIRSKFKSGVPGTVTLDWIIGALDTTQKGAGNVLPQLRLLGLTNGDNKPTDLVHDFKDDETYAAASKAIVESAYPEALREAWGDASADPAKVASWFTRNAKTGATVAQNQARLYLLMLGAKLPAPDEIKPKVTRKAKSAATKPKANAAGATEPRTLSLAPPLDPTPTVGPNLHVDLQIHISADAGDAQIEAIFKSMAKHLYGR
jgi:hypothetical protein